MGLHFYRQLRIAPGFTLNLGGREATVSAGEHVTSGTSRTRETIDLSETGLSCTRVPRVTEGDRNCSIFSGRDSSAVSPCPHQIVVIRRVNGRYSTPSTISELPFVLSSRRLIISCNRRNIPTLGGLARWKFDDHKSGMRPLTLQARSNFPDAR